MAYSLGRVTTYTCLGAAAGGLGGLGLRAADVLPVQAAMLVIANALVILLGLNLAGLGTAALAFDRVGSIVWRGVRRLGARLAPAQSPVGAVGVGVAWGFLPCGLVYGVLATALVSGSAARGALVMAAFGLGTLPNLLAAGFAAEALSRFVSRPRVRLAAGLGVVLLGVIGLMRIPGLHEHLRHGLHSMH
jgi:sulfite exporter TauE/SafE